ncbi:hybrid sensor histidine kinase/response regulator [Aureispira anguillae]|uniref:histidine kinase n=1 Tax=Aureispira anguillae TaxID=2864201 RepID=A0A915YIG9_9BACT|nr:response regulator [Aureispira anguillae]BDS13488.1 response regulator [Aureispira anguillae]
MSQNKKDTTQKKTKITNSIEQLFHLNYLATGLAVGVRLITHSFSGNSLTSILVDGCLMVVLFCFYYFSSYRKLYPALTWPFIITTQIMVLVLWLSYNSMESIIAPIYLLIVLFYALYSRQNSYPKIALGSVLLAVVLVLLIQLNPVWWDNFESTGRWIDYTMITICIIGVTTMVLDFVNQRLEEEWKKSEEKANQLDLARKEAEQRRDLLAMLKDLQSDFFLEEDLKDAFNNLLAQLLKITNSKFGFVGEVMEEKGQPYLKTHAFLDLIHNQETTVLYQNQVNQATKNANLELLFDYIIEYDNYVIANQPSMLERRGVSLEQFNLNNFLGIPVTYNYKTIGVIGIANREGGYNEALVHILSPFLSTYGSIIQNIRLKRRQEEYENELKEAKELAEYSNRLKSQFLTNISHELRTPLSLIMGPIDMMLKRSKGELTREELHSYLSIMQKNGNKMLEYIKDIMDLAKLNSNKLVVTKQKVELFPFIENIYTLFKTEIAHRNISYTLEYEVNKGILLNLDAQKIEKILSNLLSNAFKYTKDNGMVKLLVKGVDQGIEIQVCDSGIGIPSEHLPYIFNRFYQVKKENETIFSGTGVGLALVKELADIQGLEVKVVSDLSKGSCFSFILPQQDITNHFDKQQEPAITTSSLSSKQTKVSILDKSKNAILVVEDNYDMRLFLNNILNKEYEIILAENGREGLSVLKQNASDISLVITDLMMPEMDGMELLEHIKSSSWGYNLPVIVLTAQNQRDSRLNALRIGVDEYLTKPFSVDELMASIKNLIKNHKVRQGWKS